MIARIVQNGSPHFWTTQFLYVGMKQNTENPLLAVAGENPAPNPEKKKLQ